MREIDVKLIAEKIRGLCIEADTDLGEDVLETFDRAMEKEESSLAIQILKELKENARIAKEEKAEIIAYEDLGPEAIRRLEVEDLPVIVVNDVRGNDLYIEGEKKFKRN